MKTDSSTTKQTSKNNVISVLDHAAKLRLLRVKVSKAVQAADALNLHSAQVQAEQAIELADTLTRCEEVEALQRSAACVVAVVTKAVRIA